MYVTEVCCDIALGMSTQVLWLVIFLQSLVTETLMKSSLTPPGVFFMLCLFSVIAAVFEYHYVAETKGCSEREKKSLYVPGARYGRDLRPGEEPTYLERSVSARSPTYQEQSAEVDYVKPPAEATVKTKAAHYLAAVKGSFTS